MMRASVIVVKRTASYGSRNCSSLRDRGKDVRNPHFTPLRSFLVKVTLGYLGYKTGTALHSLPLDSKKEELVKRIQASTNDHRMEKQRVEASRIWLRKDWQDMKKLLDAALRRKKTE
ncbi:unnamed protein product [Microthlaspi erraticum]|uniref:Uncharacterized protein n=1 Tax=Microthlaspi erraticum TaxID=1685480 RepID=A0A6D2ICS5_9BRAS|nr:unnamed protein product [Microthlaspi erraticum]